MPKYFEKERILSSKAQNLLEVNYFTFILYRRKYTRKLKLPRGIYLYYAKNNREMKALVIHKPEQLEIINLSALLSNQAEKFSSLSHLRWSAQNTPFESVIIEDNLVELISKNCKFQSENEDTLFLKNNFPLQVDIKEAILIINRYSMLIESEIARITKEPKRNDEIKLLKAVSSSALKTLGKQKKLFEKTSHLKKTLTSLEAYGGRTKKSLIDAEKELAGIKHSETNQPQDLYNALDGLDYLQNEFCNPLEHERATYHLEKISLISKKATKHLGTNKGNKGNLILQCSIHFLGAAYYEITGNEPRDHFSFYGGDPDLAPAKSKFYEFIEFLLGKIEKKLDLKIVPLMRREILENAIDTHLKKTMKLPETLK